jgi:hypothetical protein
VFDAGFVGPPLPYALAIPDGGTIPFPQDAGFVAADFDGHGNVLFTRPNPSQRVGSDVIAMGEPINGPRPATGYSVPFNLDVLQADGSVTGPVLTRMDDLVCIPDILSGGPGTCSFAPATHTVACLQPSTGKLVLDQANNNATPNLALAPPNAGGTAGAFGSVRTYLSPNDVGPTCGPAWTFFGFPGGSFVLQPQGAPAFGGAACAVQTVNRLLPVVDGSFVLGLTMDCSGGAGLITYEVVHVAPSGNIAGSYLAKAGVTLPSQPQVLGALQGGNFVGGGPAIGAVVTMRNDPPYTTFEAYLPDGAGPVATARVPGLFVYNSATSRLARNVRAATDGSFTVLLSNAALGDVVLHFGAGLEPRFLYKYPRVVLPGSPSVLIGGIDQGNVYYVDQTNNDIVALKRF